MGELEYNICKYLFEHPNSSTLEVSKAFKIKFTQAKYFIYCLRDKQLIYSTNERDTICWKCDKCPEQVDVLKYFKTKDEYTSTELCSIFNVTTHVLGRMMKQFIQDETLFKYNDPIRKVVYTTIPKVKKEYNKQLKIEDTYYPQDLIRSFLFK